MGVKGLQYYMENCHSNACRKVSIPEFVADFKIHHQGIQPVLVVDGMSLLTKLYCRNNLEWIYGGQWIQFLDILRNFVSKFQNIGIKLVFFFDGHVVESKRSEWIKRRQNNVLLKDNAMVFIESTNQEPSLIETQVPVCLPTLVRFALKYELNVDVYSSMREADLEVAEYAKNNESVFAILGQDTDFIIFDTKPYFSAFHLNLDQMTTIWYDRSALAKHLTLSVSQLPLFACLLGNDIIPSEMVRPFHYQLCRTSSIPTLAPAASHFIRSNFQETDIHTEKFLKQFARMVLGSEVNFKLLNDSLLSYCLIPTPNLENEDIVKKRHIFVENLPGVFTIISNRIYESSEVIEDAKSPVCIAYEEVRHRCYYVAFSGQTDCPITEWLAFKKNDLFYQSRPNIAYPLSIDIPGRIPSLEELWSENSQFQEARLQCFFKCLDIHLELSHLNSIPQSYQFFSCILNYCLTRKPSLVNVWEVVAFVIQGVRLKNTNVQDLYNLKIDYVDARAIHLGSLFMHGLGIIGMVLGICGYPLPLNSIFPWNFYDGKLFHHIYCQTMKIRNVKQLCNNQEEESQVRLILSVVTSGTKSYEDLKLT